MNKTELKNLTLEELIANFYWTAVASTKETNSNRGITKKQSKAEKLIIEEVKNRLNLGDEFINALNK